MRHTSIISALTVALIFFAPATQFAAETLNPRPVNRPANTSTTTYDSLLALSLADRWDAIDELDYWAIPVAAPAGYYADIQTDSADHLRASLHALIRNHKVFIYSNSSRPHHANHRLDTWDVVSLADEHPAQPGMVVDIYMNATFSRQLVGPRGGFKYDREHSWPKSLGFPQNEMSNPAYSDCHHLFAAYSSYNGSRSNNPYGSLDNKPEWRKVTVENSNRGGALQNDEGEASNHSGNDTWETWIGRRGDVARALLYMDIRYEGPYDNRMEPNLALTDDRTKIFSQDVVEQGGTAHMGLKSTLLQWHLQDPVDDQERRRNTIVYLFQGNRNPFIDNPQWVNSVYGTGPAGVTGAQKPWINEFHYDNKGADAGEFVEIAGPAGTDMKDWSIVLYNGAGGKVYRTISLSGVIEDQSDGLGAMAVDTPGLQNGPDGIALVSPEGQVVEIIAYEGSFSATDGPAEGMDVDKIGESQSGSTEAGTSLKRALVNGKKPGVEWTTASIANPGIMK